MSARRWTVLAAILAALILVQAAGLDRRPEKIEEDRYRNLADVPPGDMLPAYVASLFFGAFRAVAIDVLWIQLKSVREEKRWYEEKEIFNFISYFQPRNPEVWSYLAWDAAYNVANGFTDREKAWEWIRFGLQWIRRGNARLPDNPHLKLELAWILFHKPAWRDGLLDLDLLRRIEEDAELQADLPPDRVRPERPRSAFELAILWLERAREELFARPEKQYRTFVGLMLYPDTMDGFINLCLYLQGVYAWRRGRWDEAKETFRRGAEHVRAMRGKPYPFPLSPIYADWEAFYARLPRLVDLDREARESPSPERDRALLAELQAVVGEFGLLNQGYLWRDRDPEAPLNALKLKLTGGKDPHECNDSWIQATPLRPGEYALATLDPRGLDADYYRIAAPAPEGREDADLRPPRPLTLRLHLNQGIAAPPLTLKVVLRDPKQNVLRSATVRGRQELSWPLPAYGTYYLLIEPADPAEPWPENTRYALQYAVEP
jgi:hypothetical protein